MYNRARQEQRDTFTEEQVKRVLQNSGVDIEGEVDSDFIIFCPYHNNFRTPAGEISKTSGLFFCFGCQEYRPLIDFVMHVTGKTYFQALRLIDSQKTDTDISGIIDVALEQEPEYIPFDEGLIERLHANAVVPASYAQSYPQNVCGTRIRQGRYFIPARRRTRRSFRLRRGGHGAAVFLCAMLMSLKINDLGYCIDPC